MAVTPPTNGDLIVTNAKIIFKQNQEGTYDVLLTIDKIHFIKIGTVANPKQLTSNFLNLIPQYVNDYGGGFANFTPPSDVEEGTIIYAEDTNATTPGKRLYVYANGKWSYVALT